MTRPARHRCPRLGSYLRRCREDSALSLKDVAEMSKEHSERISVSYLSKSELGQFTPPLGMLLTLASIYGVPIQHLVDYVVLDRVAPPPPAEDEPMVLRTQGLEAMYQGRVYVAYAAFEKALDVLGGEQDSDEARRELGQKFQLGIASALRLMGMHGISRDCLDRLLGEPMATSFLESSALYHLAMAHLALGHLPQAGGCAMEAAQLLAEPMVPHRDEDALAIERLSADILAVRARVLRCRGRYDAAVATYRESLERIEALGCPNDEIHVRTSLARALVRAGHSRDGLKEHLRAMVDARRLGDERLRCRTRLAYAVSCYELDRFDESERELTKALRVAREFDLPNCQFDAYFYLWKLRRVANDEAGERSHLRALRRLRTRVQGSWPEVVELDELLRSERG